MRALGFIALFALFALFEIFCGSGYGDATVWERLRSGNFVNEARRPMGAPDVLPIEPRENCGPVESSFWNWYVPEGTAHCPWSDEICNRAAVLVFWSAGRFCGIAKTKPDVAQASWSFPIVVDLDVKNRHWRYDNECSIWLRENAFVVLNPYVGVSSNTLGNLSSAASRNISPLNLRCVPQQTVSSPKQQKRKNSQKTRKDNEQSIFSPDEISEESLDEKTKPGRNIIIEFFVRIFLGLVIIKIAGRR